MLTAPQLRGERAGWFDVKAHVNRHVTRLVPVSPESTVAVSPAPSPAHKPSSSHSACPSETDMQHVSVSSAVKWDEINAYLKELVWQWNPTMPGKGLYAALYKDLIHVTGIRSQLSSLCPLPANGTSLLGPEGSWRWISWEQKQGAKG